MTYPIISPLISNALVLFAILLSGSLYYMSYGTNLLLVPYALFLIFLFLMKRGSLSKMPLYYTLILFSLVLINKNWVFSTTAVLFLRSLLALLFVSMIPFDLFSLIFHKQMKWILIISLPFFLV